MEIERVEFECEHCSEEDEQLRLPHFFLLPVGQFTHIWLCKMCFDRMVGIVAQSVMDNAMRPKSFSVTSDFFGNCGFSPETRTKCK